MRRYSHSALKLFQRCQLRWKYRYIDRLEPDEDRPHLERGKTLHEGLAEFYTADGDFVEWYTEADDEDRELLNRYASKYPDDDWEILHVEEEFEMQVGSYTVVYIPDLVIRIGEDVWIVDHKTTKNIPDEWDPYNMTDFQHLLYVAGMQEHYPNVRGFIFNYIRTKPPTQPKLVKDGSRIADLRRLDTDYNTLHDFAMMTGTMDADVEEKLKILMHAPDRFFQRHFLPVNQASVDAAVADIEAVLREMSDKEHGRPGGTYPRNVMSSGAGYQSCRSCEFQTLCHSEMMGIEVDVAVLGYRERPERETNEQGNA